jgi:hypothetical protein
MTKAEAEALKVGAVVFNTRTFKSYELVAVPETVAHECAQCAKQGRPSVKALATKITGPGATGGTVRSLWLDLPVWQVTT